jgi:uncharacterized phage infection (PIP) family protein YhgE
MMMMMMTMMMIIIIIIIIIQTLYTIFNLKPVESPFSLFSTPKNNV